MKKILVPFDFTRASRNAAGYASYLARAFEAEVELLHVYKEYLFTTAGSEPWINYEQDQQEENEKRMAAETDFLKKHFEIKVKSVVKPGFRSDTIRQSAENDGADLLVMGMHGETQNRKLGNTVLKTIRKTRVPVLVVPEEVKFRSLKNIALAVDFNETLSADCFDLLYAIYQKFDASLRVLHVEKKGAGLKSFEQPHKLELGAALGRFTFLYDKFEQDDIDEGIRKFVHGHPTDLLVMVGHQHNLLERILGAVHTSDISFDLDLPLLVLKKS